MIHALAFAAAATQPACPLEHAAMGHCRAETATPQPTRSGPENAADTIWDPALMREKRAEKLIAEHGGFTGSMVLIDQLELRVQDGRNAYAWDGQGWYGGDYNRLWIKSEGGAAAGRSVGAETQALYSRAVDPWFNLQIGARYDATAGPDRAYLVAGIQGLARYWFEVDAALFLSQKGDVSARVEAEYDQRLTNQLILQPRIEFDLAARDVPAIGLGSGLTSGEIGARLRYQFVPEFAPYLGVAYQRQFGRTADFGRAAGDDVGGWAFLLGVRSWF